MDLPLLPQDKANHACYGAVIFLLAVFVAQQLDLASPTIIALVFVACVGALKELADYLLNRRAIAAGLPPPHGVEFLDFAATTLGGFVCFLASVV